MSQKIKIAGSFELVGLAEAGEFQFGGNGVVYDHNNLTPEQAADLVEKGYPHLKKSEEETKKKLQLQ